MAESLSPIDSVKARWASMLPGSPVYRYFLGNIEIVSAEHGSMIATLPVTEHLLNSKNGLHGSSSATIVDWAGGMAIASTGLQNTGVSTDIHVSFVSSAKLNDILTIEGKVDRLGRNMAFTTVTIYKGEGENKSVVVTGSHTKYVLKDQPVKP